LRPATWGSPGSVPRYGDWVDRGIRVDQFGNGLSARFDDTVQAWRAANDQLLDFVGDPIATIETANADDEAFVMGSVFTTAYRILGGASPSGVPVVEGLARLDQRQDGATEQEQAHIAAARSLVSGEFELAARQWDDIAVAHPRDLLALKLTHDVCLHIGDDDIRLPSARRAVDSGAFEGDERATAVVNANLAFALEEVGQYEEAEHWGRAALAAEPTDLWARHALAHVYEATERHEDALKLLVPTSSQWSAQTLLANHIWWHVGLRLLNHGSIVEAVDVLDRELVSRTAFGLADSTSLLWRIELASAPSAPSLRWESLVEDWANVTERHTCGFLDVHAAMAFCSSPGPPAERFWEGLEASHAEGDSFNDRTFREVVLPIASSLRLFRAADHVGASDTIESVGSSLRRIGGSVVQRDVVSRTAERVDDFGVVS
jgi:tetratricopeptide (TPR) repeat protein